MTRDDFISALYDSTAGLPGGSMGGGTRIAATAFVDSMRNLNLSEIVLAITTASAVAKGPYRDWLAMVAQIPVL